MTLDEFKKKYHDYAVDDSVEALADSIKVNSVLKEGRCVPVKIGNKYCLMLDTAASLMKEIGVL